MAVWRIIMSWKGLLPGLALALSTAAHGQWGALAPAAAPNMPAPISTRQNSFAIPYTIPVPKTPADMPAEIRLFVSSDKGKSWQVAETTRLNPITETQRGQFTFRAPGDAEYWFAIRTVDRAGQLRGGRNGPELRVIVDAQPPAIKLDAQRGAAGEIGVRYEVSDASLQPQSIALSYQLAGMTDWRSVSFDKPFGAQPDKPLQGSTTFWPERAGVELQVRLEILDAAGNSGVAQVAVPIAPGVPAQPVGQQLADATRPLNGAWNGNPNPATTPQPNLAAPNPSTGNLGQQNPALQNQTLQNPALANPALAARPGVRSDDPPPPFPFGDTSRPGGTRWNDVTNPTPTLAQPSAPQPRLARRKIRSVPPCHHRRLPPCPVVRHCSVRKTTCRRRFPATTQSPRNRNLKRAPSPRVSKAV